MEDMSTLEDKVTPDNTLKEYIVNYVGEIKEPENDEVTLEMTIEVLAEQFPELLLCVAEENFIRGYHQALTDVEQGEKYMRAKAKAKNEKLHT